MADDQMLTGGQGVVDSEQISAGNSPTTKPEPFYQDELDVLEAVAKLEKKYGKELLTKEQREKLEKGGRAGILMEPKDQLSDIGSDDLVIYALEEALVEVLIGEGYYTREQWDAKAEIQKVHLLRMYCFGFLGIELEDWAQQVRNKARN